MLFKHNKVWMAVDAKEQPRIEKGKVLIKYQLDQPYQYWVLPKNINALDEEQAALQTSSSNNSNTSIQTQRPSTSDDSGLAKIEKNAETICIYTDGACSGNPGPAGIGIVMLYHGHRKEISRYIGLATNNIAELEAIRVGLISVKNKALSITLSTDSSYALGVLTKGWKAKQNQALIQEIRSLIANFQKLRFVKVKGHSGHPENERADQLAVQAIQTGNQSERLFENPVEPQPQN